MPETIRVFLEQPPEASWHWIKDYGAPITALLVALISNIVLWLKIRADLKTGIKKELTLRSIHALEEKLGSFYDPLLALLRLNRTIFDSLGPPTFPEDIHARTDAARAWNTAADDIVVPNNSKICDLLLNKSHLLSMECSTAAAEFLRHAHSYKIFRQQGNIVHRSFPFPSSFERLVEHERNVLLNELSDAKKYYLNP
ncbi:MAG: hypothetical protein WA117_03820 [Verrucomicrobiia bacterium]